MRIGLLAVAAVLFAGGPAVAAEPAIVFQAHSAGRMLDDLRTAADMLGGDKGVKLLNKAIQSKLGEKGFEGLDIGRPIVGYLNLAARPEDVTVVIALPITGEKEFLDLCERNNNRKPKLVDKEKDVYELPPLDPRYTALLRFSDQYAYIASGLKPDPAVAPAALVPVGLLYDPNERGMLSGRIYFDRMSPAIKQALPALLDQVKKDVLRILRLGLDEPFTKAILPDVDRLIARYSKLAAGANECAARIGVDPATGNLVVEATLNGKPGSELAAIIAARKPSVNKFGGLIATPDTILGFKAQLPLFEEEIRAGAVAGIAWGQKESANNAPFPVKPMLEELFKGLMRTVKTGELDAVGGIRGPDRNGAYTAVGAVAFEDPSALEKEYRKMVEKNAPPDEQERFKWDVATVDKINIHTYKVPQAGFFFDDISKWFGGEDCTIAYAFAPHGIFVAVGPTAVDTLKQTVAVKPAASPVLDLVVNPAQVLKFVAKIDGGNADANARLEARLGKEDKRVSAMSMTVEGGKELKVVYAVNLRLLPRLAFFNDIDRADPDK